MYSLSKKTDMCGSLFFSFSLNPGFSTGLELSYSSGKLLSSGDSKFSSLDSLPDYFSKLESKSYEDEIDTISQITIKVGTNFSISEVQISPLISYIILKPRQILNEFAENWSASYYDYSFDSITHFGYYFHYSQSEYTPSLGVELNGLEGGILLKIIPISIFLRLRRVEGSNTCSWSKFISNFDSSYTYYANPDTAYEDVSYSYFSDTIFTTVKEKIRIQDLDFSVGKKSKYKKIMYAFSLYLSWKEIWERSEELEENSTYSESEMKRGVLTFSIPLGLEYKTLFLFVRGGVTPSFSFNYGKLLKTRRKSYYQTSIKYNFGLGLNFERLKIDLYTNRNLFGPSNWVIGLRWNFE